MQGAGFTRWGPVGVVVAGLVAGCGDDTPLTATSGGEVTRVAAFAVPPDYGLHDTYVRDGLAFLSAWNSGVIILDVGHGIAGGSPADPREVARVPLPAGTVTGRAHNAWWFHNPVTGEARYLFVGQEGPGALGSSSSGDLYAFDVSDLADPQFVARFTIPGSGVHNVWMDEPGQVLYAAYYNAGVVALDVSGTLPVDLAGRELARTVTAPGATFVWGVMLAPDGALYASDMLSGFWRLQLSGGALSVTGGGNNVPTRFTSDLWVHAPFAYSGTWGTRTAVGNTVNIWLLTDLGPQLVDSVKVETISTVSDVEVSSDGRVLLFSSERTPDAGIHLYSLAVDPTSPDSLLQIPIDGGVHTATLAEIAGRHYVLAARNPGLEGPALEVWDVTAIWP